VMVVCDMVTFHDEYRPQRRAKVIERTTLPLAGRRADVFAAISQATADDLAAHFPRTAAKTVVTPLAADEHFFAAQPGDVRERLGLERPYVLAVGTLEPRKNLPALIRAWSTIDGAPDLVLAGGRGWDEEVERAAAAVPAGHRLHRPGYLPLEMLAGYLGEAQLVVYPSLGEGFGLPVLEAMACGAPVLTTKLLAIPEIGGDAVAYTGTDTDSIAADLRALLAEPRRRVELAAAGLERAASFDWRSCARAHLAAYTAAVGG
jgi:glycosyltransferase involved in cell wall biosynthesis